jgi:hypothetical protein
MAPKASPCTQKFGAPLYAGAFLTDELLVLGGGGGKKSSGIANRCARGLAARVLSCNSPLLVLARSLMVAKWADGVLSPDPVFTHNTGDEPPERCAAAACARAPQLTQT